MNTIIEKIRAEVNRLKPRIRKICGEEVKIPVEKVREKFDTLLSFLSDLEKSEKPINPVIQDFPTTEKEMQDFLATHERIPVPERLNSLERILQEQPVCEDLKKRASEIYPNKEGDLCSLHSTLQRGGYIRGYQDCKEQMMKEAVEGEVYLYHSYNRDATAILVDIPKENLGDKVRIIVLQKED